MIISSLGAAISDNQVTYDLARLMEGAHEISTTGFAQAMIERMWRAAAPLADAA